MSNQDSKMGWGEGVAFTRYFALTDRCSYAKIFRFRKSICRRSLRHVSARIMNRFSTWPPPLEGRPSLPDWRQKDISVSLQPFRASKRILQGTSMVYLSIPPFCDWQEQSQRHHRAEFHILHHPFFHLSANPGMDLEVICHFEIKETASLLICHVAKQENINWQREATWKI